MPIRNPSTVYELSLKGQGFQATTAILKQFLVNSGVNSSQIVESNFGLASGVSVYFENRRRAALLIHRLRRAKLKGVSETLKTLKRRDYENRWKEDFCPFHLTKTIDVVPAWEKKSFKPNGRIPIYIDTTSAFGTGLHETTRFMAELIESRRGQFKNFLDVGTGSGILCLIALKSGAQRVKGIDNDKNTLEPARANFRRNNFAFNPFTAMDISRAKGQGEYDFVAANLITLDLIKFQKNLLSFVKPSGFLAVSGISLENFALFQKKFKNPALRCLKIIKGKQWAALLFRRRGRAT